jgi:hypothetical protein
MILNESIMKEILKKKESIEEAAHKSFREYKNRKS